MDKFLKNRSVVNIAEIATEYKYKMEIVYVNTQRAFLSISEPFFKSPYSRHITSKICSAKYVERIFDMYSF